MERTATTPCGRTMDSPWKPEAIDTALRDGTVEEKTTV